MKANPHIVRYLYDEIARADERYGGFKSTHEGLGVLLEEGIELLEAVHKNDRLEIRKEAIQVAAVAVRLAISVDDDETWERSTK